eukprot:1592247-Alexandrium_andersonii.AAC.1
MRGGHAARTSRRVLHRHRGSTQGACGRLADQPAVAPWPVRPRCPPGGSCWQSRGRISAVHPARPLWPPASGV